MTQKEFSGTHSRNPNAQRSAQSSDSAEAGAGAQPSDSVVAVTGADARPSDDVNGSQTIQSELVNYPLNLRSFKELTTLSKNMPKFSPEHMKWTRRAGSLFNALHSGSLILYGIFGLLSAEKKDSWCKSVYGASIVTIVLYRTVLYRHQ